MWPFERIVLICFALMGAVFIFYVTRFVDYCMERGSLPRAFRMIVCIPISMLCALVWADGIAHHGKALILRYDYNPRVMAIGELEGWNGPSTGDPVDIALWQKAKCLPVYVKLNDQYVRLMYEGDPGSGQFCGEVFSR